MKRMRHPIRTTVANANDDLPTSALGNDLRTVFRDQNHMLLLCTSSTVLVDEAANHVSERNDGR
jgi:hypothetical protein